MVTHSTHRQGQSTEKTIVFSLFVRLLVSLFFCLSCLPLPLLRYPADFHRHGSCWQPGPAPGFLQLKGVCLWGSGSGFLPL